MESIKEIKEITEKHYNINRDKLLLSIEQSIEGTALLGRYKFTIENELYELYTIYFIKYFLNLGFKVKINGDMLHSYMTISWDDNIGCQHKDLKYYTKDIDKCANCYEFFLKTENK